MATGKPSASATSDRAAKWPQAASLVASSSFFPQRNATGLGTAASSWCSSCRNCMIGYFQQAGAEFASFSNCREEVLSILGRSASDREDALPRLL